MDDIDIRTDETSRRGELLMGEKTVPYAEIRETLMTGDIVLFHGLGWESDIIQVMELSQWTHVAMVVRAPEIDYPLIWESTPLQFIEDKSTHKKKAGARLVSLDERLAVAVEKRLYGRFAVRHLEVARSAEMIETVKSFISGKVHHLTFPSDWKMLLEFLQGRLFMEEKTRANNIYCAELVAETYKQMGLLSHDVPSNRFLPKDFSSKVELNLLKDAKLGEEIFLIVGEHPSPAG
jgi:hypothetical protein